MTKPALIFKAALALLLIFYLITIHIPQSIYFTQREYFADYFINLIIPSLLYGLAAVVLSLLVLSVLPQKLFKYVAAILLVFSLLLWANVDFFTVSYGALDGSEIDFSQYNQRGYIEIGICFVALLLSIVFNRFILQQFPFLVGLLLIGLLVITSINVYQEPLDKKQAGDIDQEFFNYSSEKNIILIVLDTFGAEYFQKALIQDPSIANNLEGFVSYTDAISNYPATRGSVPSFLTGKMIPENEKYRTFLSDYVANYGLPALFSQKGYLVSVISVYTWFKYFYEQRYMSQPQLKSKTLKAYYSAQLLDYSLFRAAPHYLKHKVFDEGNWFFSKEISKKADIPNSFPEKGNFFLNLMTENIVVADESPRFKMIHVTTPHPEYRFNRRCELEQLSPAKNAMLEQSMCALKKLDELLAAYKENGVYDNSLIVVTSDHGSRVLADKSLTGIPSYFEMNTSGILFMMKGIGQNEDFKQVHQPFSLIKLYAALADEKLHQSKYDFLKDDNREFYAYRNGRISKKGYMSDAPLFKVTPNYSNPESWQLKRYVTQVCDLVEIPLVMTFKTTGREGYCSIYGFSKPSSDGEGSWTQSVDARIVLKLDSDTIEADQTYSFVLDFSPFLVGGQKSINLKIMINDVKVGEQLITTKGNQTITFNFEGSLINSSEQTVIQLLMPELKSPKEMLLNSNTHKLGLFMNSIEIK